MTNLDEVVKAVQLYASGAQQPLSQQLRLAPRQLRGSSELVPPGNGVGSGVATWFTKGSSNTTSADVAALYLAGITNAVPTISQPSGRSATGAPPTSPTAPIRPLPRRRSRGSARQPRLRQLNGRGRAVRRAHQWDVRHLRAGQVQHHFRLDLGPAPVYFSATQGYDPDHVYARFGLVFQTADAGGRAARGEVPGRRGDGL